jgi:hypothetical protein
MGTEASRQRDAAAAATVAAAVLRAELQTIGTQLVREQEHELALLVDNERCGSCSGMAWRRLLTCLCVCRLATDLRHSEMQLAVVLASRAPPPPASRRVSFSHTAAESARGGSPPAAAPEVPASSAPEAAATPQPGPSVRSAGRRVAAAVPA